VALIYSCKEGAICKDVPRSWEIFSVDGVVMRVAGNAGSRFSSFVDGNIAVDI